MKTATPFDQSTIVLESANVTGGYKFNIGIINDHNLQPENIVLIKYLIKSELPVSLGIKLVNNTDHLIYENSSGKIIEAGFWYEVSSINKLQTTHEINLSTKPWAQTIFFDYDTKQNNTITFQRPLIVNLTEVFGKGNEPDINQNEEIQRFFPFVESGTMGKTIN